MPDPFTDDFGSLHDDEPAFGQTLSNAGADHTGPWIDTAPGDQQKFNSYSFLIKTRGGSSNDEVAAVVEESGPSSGSNVQEVTDSFGNNFKSETLEDASGYTKLKVTNTGTKRYLRLKIKSGDLTINGTDIEVDAVVVKGGPKVQPA